MHSAADCLNAAPPRLLAALAASASEPLYLVGGFVRDVLLERPTHDLDVAVEEEPLRLAHTLARRLGGAVVPLDPERGTYRLALREPAAGIRDVDLNRLRRPTIEEDLRGRDFTINAIAVQIGAAAPRLIDVTGGLQDLDQRLVRAASADAFTDDPLRLLRAARFCVQLGFELEPATADRIREQAALLNLPAAERRRDEFAHILAAERAGDGVRLLHDLKLLFRLLPELAVTAGVEQPKEHYYDVFEHCLHTLAALDAMLATKPPAGAYDAMLWRGLWAGIGWLPIVRERLHEVTGEGRKRSVTLKLAGLLHDAAKPETKTVDPETGRMHFFGHDDVGARIAAAAARRLRFSAREAEYVEVLIREHLRPGMLAAPGDVPTRRALYRFARDLGDAAPDLLLLNLADHAAARGPRLEQQEWERHVGFVAWVLHMLYVETAVSRPPQLLTGHDLMRELKLASGPLIGRLLDAVREAQADGAVSTSAQALEYARNALAGLSEAGGP